MAVNLSPVTCQQSTLGTGLHFSICIMEIIMLEVVNTASLRDQAYVVRSH